MKMRWLGIAVAAAVFAFACGAASALPVSLEFGPNLVTNGGFETGDLTGWTQSGNTTFTGASGANPHTGSFALNEGPVGTLGFISQDLATIAGAQYNIHLWFAASGGVPSELRIDWGGVTYYDQTDLPNNPYSEIVIDPMATSSLTTLKIGFRDDPTFDDIDDISVYQTQAIPEPITLMLFGTGLAGMGVYRRRTR